MSNNIYSVLWRYNRYPWIVSPSYKILKNGRKIRSNSREIHPRIWTLSLRSEWVSLLLHSCSERKLQLLDWCLTPTLPGTTHPSLDHCPTPSPGPSTPAQDLPTNPGSSTLLWNTYPALDHLLCPGQPTLSWINHPTLDHLPCPGSTTTSWTTYPALDPPLCSGTHTHTRPRSPTLPWTTPVSFFKPSIEVNSLFCVYYFIFDVQT